MSNWYVKQESTTVWQEYKTDEGLSYYYNSETGETSWDKPDELLTDADAEQSGDWVWFPHPTHCFVAAKLTGEDARYWYGQDEEGEALQAKKKEHPQLDQMKWSSIQEGKAVSDMVRLDEMTAPLILWNLRTRFQQKHIYTNVGTICIAINPFEWLDGLYGADVMSRYQAKLRDYKEMPPHVYIIADNAYKGMTFKNGRSQSIVISGESGAGKTEATKQCLAYINHVAGAIGNVSQKVLQSNPILEAFGNAKTIRNNNSSRFGKYVEMFFTHEYHLCGGRTTNYLLEKVRVVHQAPGERNFHIFYQLCRGLDSARKRAFGLGKPEHHYFMKQGGDTVVPHMDDAKEFAEVLEGFTTLGFAQQEQDEILALVAGLVHLGDVDFNTVGQKKVVVKNPTAFKQVATLLKLENKVLQKGLVRRTLRMRGQEDIDVGFSGEEARVNRDALAKFVYGKLFDWIVVKINESMAVPAGTPRDEKTIGILDIFGFEIFEQNSFEQLCINFTNEKLQQNFNQNVFKKEEETYLREAIDFEHVDFVDNQPILDLIEQAPHGLLAKLDEELKMPKGADESYLHKCLTQHRGSRYYRQDTRYGRDTFVLSHYAGDVVYNVNGFMDKNRDTLSQDLLDLVHASHLPLLQTLFAGNNGQSDRKASLGKQFKQQLDVLMTQLYSTSPHYIRCIKPNEQKAPMAFTARNVHEQLNYSGVYEAVRIRKLGYPFRLKHSDFCERYGVVFGERSSGLSGCEALVQQFRLNMSNVRFGRSMVFYRSNEHKTMELRRSIHFERARLVQELEELNKTRPDSLPGYHTPGYSGQCLEFFKQFARAVRRSNELSLQDEPVVAEANRLFDQYIENRMDPNTKRALEAAMAAVDESQLKRALAQADKYDYGNSLVRSARALFDKVAQANEQCRTAFLEVDEEALRAALALCREVNLRSTHSQAAESALQEIEAVTQQQHAALAAVDRVQLEAAVNAAEQLGGKVLSSATTQECRDLIVRIDAMDAELEAARQSMSETHIAAALSRAADLGLEDASTAAARETHSGIVQLHMDCDAAVAARDDAAIQDVLVRAYECGLGSERVLEAQALLDRIRRIDEESQAALSTLHEAHMRACIESAEAIALDSLRPDTIEKMRNLLSLSSQKLIEEQLRVATTNKDEARKLWLQISLKEQIFATMEQFYSVRQYEKIKTSEYWASEKLLGKKEALAAGFLYFTDSPVHASFTDMTRTEEKSTRKLSKEACAMFKLVLAYMGHQPLGKNTHTVDQAADQALGMAIAEPQLRNELYIQLIKQLSRNNSGSKDKAWALLKLTLATFPPGTDFENHVEVWLRANAPGPEYRVALHKALNELRHKPALQPPPMNQFASIIANTDAIGFEEPVPAGWENGRPFDDLAVPFRAAGGLSDEAELPRYDAQAAMNATTAGAAQMAGDLGPLPQPGGLRAPGAAPTRRTNAGATPQLPTPRGNPLAGSTRGPGAAPVAPTQESTPMVPPVAPVVQQTPPEAPVAMVPPVVPPVVPTPAPVPPTPPVPEVKKIYYKHLDDASGDYYYENTETGEVSWDAPADSAQLINP